MAQNLALAALRAKIECDLRERASAPFDYHECKFAETASIGILEIDYLAGGLPRGGFTEICGPPCSGRTSFLLSALASRTAHSEVCVLVDGSDNFDPYSAQAAGVELKQLLWVRCRNIDQALRATDLLLQGRGFGLIALDLSDIPPKIVRHVPLNAWFRFRRSVEDTQTIFVVLDQEPNAKTCASLVLRLGSEAVRWSTTMDAPTADSFAHPSACLLDGFDVRAEVLRSRVQKAVVAGFHRGFAPASIGGDTGIFGTKAIWSGSDNLLLESQSKKLKKRE